MSTGAVWILFLNADGTVKSEQKISPAAGGFMGQLDNFDRLGVSMSSLGDLDGDGLSELAVGAMGDDDGGTERGSLWILFLNADGTVKSHQKISDADGGFAGDLADGDVFGSSVARLGDLDGNGTIEIVVGAMFSDDGANAAGAVWIIFLNPDGTVLDRQEISATSGGFQGILDVGDTFGIDVSRLTDLDGDGVMDVGVGAINDDDGGSNRGAVWVLFLNPDGTVKAHSKISSTSGGLQGPIDDGDILGSSVKLLGDLDADGQPEVAVGASRDDDGGEEAGAVWILTLDRCQPLGIVSGPSPCAILLPPEGGLAIFEVIAEGAAPLMYQWRRDGVPLSNGGTVSGADSPMLTIAAGEADVGHYDCVVTSGDGRVTSAAAVLALRPPCHGDLNRDGVVDGADLGLLLAGWGLCEP
jgi:hypothetical protein